MQLSLTKKAEKDREARRGLHPLVIIGALFFIFGFVTWVNSVLIPYLQISCELNSMQAYLVAFSFYISYFVMAVPSGWVLRRAGYKEGMSFGLALVAAGSVVFIPAALFRTYWIFLAGLFVQGAGLALLQTAANPYVTILGPLESAARRMSIMGICNGVAGILAPAVLGAVILSHADELTRTLAHLSTGEKAAALDALSRKVILPYIAIAFVLAMLALWIYRSGLPEIREPLEEDLVEGDGPAPGSIWHFPHLVIGATVLFLYVGVEVITGNTIIQYGAFQHIPLAYAKFFTSFVLTGMLVGYVVGICCIPKCFSQRTALAWSAVLGTLCVAGALTTRGLVSVVFVACMGLANSLMYPSIWPLAIDGLGRLTKRASALLVMAISGGALLPLGYGWLADHTDARRAYWIVVPCYLIIGYYALRGYRTGRKKTAKKTTRACY